jgi:agmatinase
MSEHSNFDPNSVALSENNIFGLPFSAEEAQLILLPVPWEATVSYRTGTAEGPDCIYSASMQVDLFDPDYPNVWKKGYHMLPGDEELYELGVALRERCINILDAPAMKN